MNAPPATTIAEAFAAWAAVGEFWSALAKNDDAAIVPFLDPRAPLGVALGHAGLAWVLRAQLDVTADECASMGHSTTVRVLPDGRFAFLSLPTTQSEAIESREADDLEGAWILLVIDAGDGQWRIWDRLEAADVELSTTFDLPVFGPVGRA